MNPIEYVMKVYVVFDTTYFFYLNAIDLDAHDDLERIDGAKHLKNKIAADHHNNSEVKDFVKHITTMFRNNGHVNFGIDLIRPVGTQDYYILDINPDGMSWARFFNTSAAVDILREGLLKIVNNK